MEQGTKPRMVIIQTMDRKTRKSTMASTIAELLEKGADKFDAGSFRHVILEQTGAEIDEDEVFQSLPQSDILTLLKDGEEWKPESEVTDAENLIENPLVGKEIKAAAVEIERKSSDPWPAKFSLDVKLEFNTENQLDGQIPLNEYGRSHLLDTMYKVATKYTMYPTHDQYVQMIDFIFDKWPYLAETEDGLSSVDIKTLWLKRLRNKFSNNRKRKESKLSIVQEKKLKYGSKNNKQTLQPSDGNMYGLPSYLPSKPASEDETSTTKHIRWLQEAFKSRSKADQSKVEKLMTLTLYKQREEITNGEDVKTILERYPWLSTADQVALEFKRISCIDIDENFANFMNENTSAISTMVVSIKTKPELFTSLQDLQDNYATECRMIFGLILLMNEDITNLVGDVVPEPEVAPAFIKCNAANFLNEKKFGIYVDGLFICDTDNFVKAFMTYICMYYIFNMAYRTLGKTLTFFDCVMLKLKPDIRQKAIKKCVIQVIDKLNGFKLKESHKVKNRKSKKGRK